jgi:hypothetical protein
MLQTQTWPDVCTVSYKKIRTAIFLFWATYPYFGKLFGYAMQWIALYSAHRAQIDRTYITSAMRA